MDIDHRPAKKRRFFTDESPVRQLASLSDTVSPPHDHNARGPPTATSVVESTPSDKPNDVFDPVDFKSVVGADVPQEAITILQKTHGSNLEQAINAYFDGSWKNTTALPVRRPSSPSTLKSKQQKLVLGTHDSAAQAYGEQIDPKRSKVLLESMPKTRYIGSLGVSGWATCSGLGLLKPEDPVMIERCRQQIVQKSGRGGKMVQQTRRTQDVIVRFTNAAGKEIGRLEKETAIWMSALIDQGVCQFEGRCIYAPDRIRTNDTIYIQLRCFLLRPVFSSSNFIRPLDNNRETGLFEVKETNEERDLRLRQIGLVKLFSEINLHPSKSNETTAKHKREGILQAAEHAEQASEAKESRPAAENDELGSSSPSNEEGEELEQDQLDSLYKKAQSFDFNTPEAQPAKSFSMDLRKYQKQALHWMLNKETRENDEDREQGQSMHPLWEEYSWPIKDADDKDLPSVTGQECFYVNPYSGELSLDFPVQEQTCLGGVLADEMGLGKTIQMLSLVHSNRSPEHLAALDAAESSEKDMVNSLTRQPPNTSNLKKALATTLVVAPMSLLAQWASEAEKASKPGTIRVLIYYGSEKGVNLQTLCCGSNLLAAPNVIITSYGVVLSEFNSLATSFGGNRTTSGGLFGVEYWRIILDEAHMIKNRQSKTAKACYELAAMHRWVLTGTPIVNRLEDLFSLVRFLRVEPWSNFSFWKTFITVPFEKGEFVRALDVVQTVLEPLVMRRTKDMKTPDGEALVALPPRTIAIEKIKLSTPEQDVYDHIFLRAKKAFTANVEAGTLMKSYTTIFAQILRLRQSCCHPILTRNKNIVADEEDAAAAADIANGLADDMDLGALIERFAADEGDQDASKFGAHVLKQIQDEADMECPICAEEPMEEHAVTGCWHSACKKCLLDYIEHETAKGELPRCFNCREPITARDVFEVIRHDDEDLVMDELDQELHQSTHSGDQPKDKPRITLRRVNQLSSAKIATLLTHLKKVRKTNPTSKSVVFSQFTSFLDLLAPALKAANITTLRFDGSMSQKDRARVLNDFANRPTFTILLLSLRAGGVGLNLTCANRVYMMDPWWSFAVEAQAIDRVHRMGQTEEVHVIRFIVEGSIEEKMLKVQDRKKFM
jgi:DNA repair protein RAD5